MRRRSAFLRLTAILGLAFFAATAAVLALVYFIVAGHLESRMRVLVASDLTGLADLYEQRRIPALRAAIVARLERGNAEGAVYLLLTPTGTLLAGNLDAWPADLAANEDRIVRFTGVTAGVPAAYAGLARTLPGDFRLAVGHSAAENEAVLARLIEVLAVAGLALLALGGAGAVLLSRWLVGRIVAVNAVAGAVRAGDLSARVPAAETRDEFGDLAANVNAMLDRIQRLVGGLREVSDRIAHELRTPLTRLRSRMQQLDASPAGSAEAQAARAAISDEIAKTLAIFDALLDIATTEAEAGDTSRLKTVDLADVVTDVVDLYDAVAEERGIRLSVASASAGMLGDRGLLVRMLANVVDNAIKFSPAGGAVEIAIVPGTGNHLVTVRDSGPGLGADIRDRAFDRFARGTATAAVPGHGLGLALVRAIAVRHGIRIALADASPGLTVTFTCPALNG